MRTYVRVLFLAIVLVVAGCSMVEASDHARCNDAVVYAMTVHSQVRIAYQRHELSNAVLDREANALRQVDDACVSMSRRS